MLGYLLMEFIRESGGGNFPWLNILSPSVYDIYFTIYRCETFSK